MSYMHIPNLYKEQDILLLKECFALEKIHGTSAHLTWKDNHVSYFPGGESAERFHALFDDSALTNAFQIKGHATVTIYGEAYGGKQQGQSWRYGKQLRFVAFEVRVGECWLAVSSAAAFVADLGLEFVHFARISTTLEALNAERDAPSEQARRNGVEGIQPREGIVLRPIIELIKSNGDRIIAKHKRDEERETKSPRAVIDPAKLVVLEQATAIAEEWVTPTRLQHVLDKLGPCGMEQIPNVITAMVEDVLREGNGEIVDSKEVRRAIGAATAHLFKAKIREVVIQ